MARAKSEAGWTVEPGTSHAQPPRSRTDARSAARTMSGPLVTGFTPVDVSAASGRSQPQTPRAGLALRGETQQRMQQHVGAALDGVPIAHLVDTVAAAAARGDEDHPRVGDAGEVLGV